ncbi:MAG: hypothetical protein J1E36_06915 [Eubacterium sp.]|nr:hypothetical protein [Eubacterium sp.]
MMVCESCGKELNSYEVFTINGIAQCEECAMKGAHEKDNDTQNSGVKGDDSQALECMNCKTKDAQIDCYEINGEKCYLCSDCVGKVEADLIDKKQEILSKKSKFLPGLVGALLGSLIGCVVYFFAFRLGFLAAITGLITAVCALKGYELLGGALDKKGVFTSVIVIILSVFFANKIAWSYEAYSELKDYGADFFNCFRSLNLILQESELTGSYYIDLAVAYLMTILGAFGNIKKAFKSSTGSYKIKKVEK